MGDDDGRFPDCRAECRAGGHRAEDIGKSEPVAIALSLLVPGTVMVYLGDRMRGLACLGVSVIILALSFLMSGYITGGSIGIRVDALPGCVTLALVAAVRIHSNYRTRRSGSASWGPARSYKRATKGIPL